MKNVENLIEKYKKSLLVWVQILLKFSIEVMKQNFNKNDNFIEMVFTY
jgi:hypothetical protein